MELWLEYVLRFSHLVAGIAWIGSSFYFIWLDSSFEPLKEPRKNVDGELFMVHGGFYYRVEKRKIYPGEMPANLHWFKWEATLTWVTGFLLLIVLYFLRGASLLVDPSVQDLSQVQAVTFSLAAIVVSWVIYDLLWHPRWTRGKALQVVASFLLLGGLAFGLTRVFSGRGAFILAGAILGSLMLLNVWVRILPGQRKMVQAAERGEVPDYSVSLKSKTRSVHNTYFIFPVLFLMLSNHYPLVYNHALNWVLLLILAISGACARHAMVTKNPVERWTVLPAAVGLFALVWLTGQPRTAASVAPAGDAPVEITQLQTVFQARCWSCHSSHNTDDIFKAPPNGVLFETEAQIRARAAKIREHVVQAKTMPLMNKTQMTDEERALVDRWLNQQKL